jgi:outer membrane immunogenic protein
MRTSVTAIFAASTLLASAVAASAADMPLKAPPLDVPFSWTGPYIGGNLGWVRGNADFDPVCPNINPNCPVIFPGFVTTLFIPGIGNIPLVVPGAFATIPGGTASGRSFMGGAQAGYNWRFNQFVFGLEGDVDATHIRASLLRNAFVPGSAPGFFGTTAVNSTFESDWMASVRARLGVAWQRVLFYGTGGVAFAGSSVNTGFVYTPPAGATFVLPPPTGANSSQVLMGWTAGGGAEWSIDNDWSLGAEYRHSDFGRQTYVLGMDAGAPPMPITTNVKFTTDQVTVRLNWRWGAK